jgi:hypothetical protein
MRSVMYQESTRLVLPRTCFFNEATLITEGNWAQTWGLIRVWVLCQVNNTAWENLKAKLTGTIFGPQRDEVMRLVNLQIEASYWFVLHQIILRWYESRTRHAARTRKMANEIRRIKPLYTNTNDVNVGRRGGSDVKGNEDNLTFIAVKWST